MPPPPHHRPPHHPPHHGAPHQLAHGPRGPVPASRALAFIDPVQLDALLQPLVADAADRSFVARCLVGEGPIHHRGANYVLIALLAKLLPPSAPTAGPAGPAVPAAPESAPPTDVPVPMRLPPHLADAVEDGNFPLRLPTRALLDLAGGDTGRLDAMIDCLTDGPPQHVLANVVLVTLIEQLLTTRPGG